MIACSSCPGFSNKNKTKQEKTPRNRREAFVWSEREREIEIEKPSVGMYAPFMHQLQLRLCHGKFSGAVVNGLKQSTDLLIRR